MFKRLDHALAKIRDLRDARQHETAELLLSVAFRNTSASSRLVTKAARLRHLVSSV